MNIQEALWVVYELAEQTALDAHEAGELGMQDEFAEQQEALNQVYDFIVNNFDEEDGMRVED